MVPWERLQQTHMAHMCLLLFLSELDTKHGTSPPQSRIAKVVDFGQYSSTIFDRASRRYVVLAEGWWRFVICLTELCALINSLSDQQSSKSDVAAHTTTFTIFCSHQSYVDSDTNTGAAGEASLSSKRSRHAQARCATTGLPGLGIRDLQWPTRLDDAAMAQSGMRWRRMDLMDPEN